MHNNSISLQHVDRIKAKRISRSSPTDIELTVSFDGFAERFIFDAKKKYN